MSGVCKQELIEYGGKKMGLFLQAAIMPECKEADARAAVKAVAEKKGRGI